jgi:hypothetical protein
MSSDYRLVFSNPRALASSIDDFSRITGQNAFEAISRKPDLTRVREALYYFSAGILTPSEPAWQSMIALNKGIA